MRTIIVLPAYRASKTLKRTVDDIPKDYIDEIILVDDCSDDDTISIALKEGIKIFNHQSNLGYGANQKTCYTHALLMGAEIIVMLHPDYQYDPKLVKYFVEMIKDDYFDVMLGSRIRTRKDAVKNKMPLYKYVSNRILSFIQNIATGQNLSEWHTGMRAYKREVLASINFHSFSNNYLFDSEMLFKIVEKGYRIGEISIPVRYDSDSSSIRFTESTKYGLGTLYLTFSYLIRTIWNGIFQSHHRK